MPHHTTLPQILRDALEGKSPLETIALPTGAVDPVELKNFSTIGSYSFADEEKATVLIPLKLPVKPRPDSGHGLVDGNALKSPLCPLEPAIQTASLLSASSTPKVDFSTFDFILDRNTLRKLYGMVRDDKDAFRIDGELLGGKTVMLTRVETDNWDRIIGFKGYSEEFRKSVTSIMGGLEEGAFGGAYWRLAKYDLGPLTLFIRYEVDAQLAVHAAPTATAPVSVPDLTDLLAATSLSTFSTAAKTHSFPAPSTLTYRLTSTPIAPQSSMIKIKTRPSHKPIIPSIYWDQLFFSQTPNLWVATYLRSGLFPAANLTKYELDKGELTKYELDKGELKRFGETEGMAVVAKVVKVLVAMKEVVVREGKKGFGVSFVWEADTKDLEVWRTKEGKRRRLAGEKIRGIFD